MPTRSETKPRRTSRARASTAAGRSRAGARRNGKPAASKRAAKTPAKKRVAKPATHRRAARKPAGKRATRKPTGKRKPGVKRATARKRTRKLARTRSLFSRAAGRRRIILVAAVPAVLAAAYFGWFRDSALVAVRDVEVAGVSGSQKQRIEKALGGAARGMTTLHVDEDALTAAVAAFPDVAAVSADPSFPSGLEITVEQRPPVLLAQSQGQTVAVAGDGAVLSGLDLPKGEKLPSIEVDELPRSGLLEGEDLEQALIAGAAPEPLRPLIEKVSYEKDEGVLLTLEGGLPVHFGTGSRAEAKWAALAAVLADPKLKRLTYVDVRVPERAAAGGAAPAAAPEEEPAAAAVPETTDPASAEAAPAATPETAPAAPAATAPAVP